MPREERGARLHRAHAGRKRGRNSLRLLGERVEEAPRGRRRAVQQQPRQHQARAQVVHANGRQACNPARWPGLATPLQSGTP